MQALYISPMRYGDNITVDAMAHAMDDKLARANMELKVAYADFRDDRWLAQTIDYLRQAGEQRVAAVVLYSINPYEPAGAVAELRAVGIPVVCMERPRFAVDASVVLPNFNHGLYMAEHLATLLPPGSNVGVIGGPGVADDTELLLGILHGLETSGLTRVNDPFDLRYRNESDVRAGGVEKAANLLADFPEIEAIVPYNDESALGAIDALEAAGSLGRVKLISRNGSPRIMDHVARGRHSGTWDHDVLGLGHLLGEMVVRLAVDGERLDGLCLAGPIGRMITPETAHGWQPWEERVTWRALTSWASQ
jgi:ABC-type sugar transport system substrate-binding protein